MITISETRDHELIASLNEEVQNLHHELHPQIFKVFDKAATTEAIKVFLTNADCRAYIAIKNDDVIGYVIAYVRETKESAFHYSIKSVYIDQIGVLKKHRKSGAGKLLLQQVEQLARENNISRIELDHWTANTVAAAYFRKNGYELCKERLCKIL